MFKSLKHTAVSSAFVSLALTTGFLPVAMAQGNQFANSPKVTLRLTSASPAAMEDSKAMNDAAEFLKKETNGTVILQPYFASALFDEIAGMEAVQSGLVDMAVACTCNLTKQTSSMMFSDVPYLWNEMDNGKQVWNSEVGQEISRDMTQKLGMVPVAFTPSGGGYRILWNNKRQVKVPADVQGLKIRTTATPLEQEFWRALGAVPTPVDVKEIYTALQHGMVDAEHLQPAWFTMLRHDEVVKYGTEIRALAVYRITVIAQKSYAKLDAPQKVAFDKAMKVFEQKAYDYNRALRAEALQKVQARKIEVYTPNPQEQALWRTAGEAFLQSQTVKSSVPQPVIARVVKAQQ
ncbi:TRAP transporter substrate-binding protein [Ottowia sp.]|uniref:TRAP transporter substrate-binding protein n=1 Tax=Ottowia sp. TaxID=1898956 RepID=UPI0025FDC477|nr:TRAP transporter substrate-binding protein [Ottowia sp.]MBK6616804.1 TRAP transporter substrate-binding protein [Ottowia sp.]